MSNPLKRIMNPLEEGDDIAINVSTSSRPGFGQRLPYRADFPDTPWLKEYREPGYVNPGSDIPVIETVNSLPDLFSNILLDQSAGTPMSQISLDETGYNIDAALVEWENDMALSNFGSSQLTPIRFHENSTFSPVATESSPSGAESFTSADTEDTICYGMLYNVDVKLVGDMQIINSKLGRGIDGYDRFKLKEEEKHIILCFQNDDEKFGYLRSAEGKTLAPLLARSNIEFEPFVSTNHLKAVIGHANKSADARVKVNINMYGPQGAATEVGNTLSKGKMWLQKPDHARCGVVYDSPHFLTLKIDGIQVRPVQPLSQAINEKLEGMELREDRLRKMVEEVYTSLSNTRHLELVEGGDMVTRTFLRHQQEALGFMLERETGHINDKYRLWKTVILEDGSEEITMAKAKQGIKPDERGGGILADEMGMGKSLSILALITKTLDDGKEWAQQQNDSAEGKNMFEHSRSTLVVVPYALLITNWIEEIKTHLKGGLKVVKYHGSSRPSDRKTVSDSEIVLTTYNTLTAEFQAKTKSSILHQIGWYRVVLDEAHIIRRTATFFYHACADLHANSRWCLTGTPIQNRLSDIGALVAFIRAEPFSKAGTFRRWIEVPFGQSDGDSTIVKDRLVALLDALCLRRTKDIIKLPQLRQRMRTLEFSSAEREQYKNTKKILMRMIRQRVGEFEKSSKFGLFQANLQLRLLCNHGTFQQPFSWHTRSYRDEREAAVSALGQNGEITCSGCKLPMPILGSSRLGNDFREQCAHVLCSECIEESTMPGGGTQPQNCPVCLAQPTRVEGRVALRDIAIPDWSSKAMAEEDNDYYFNAEGCSTKMRALIEDVKKDLQTTKSIIFSCWTRTLHLLSKYLDGAKIPYHRIDGGCPLRQRQTKLDLFASDDERRVLIMTTGTGGFGLNLTCANRVFIVELQWNPGVESQAIARAIRLGQENEVLVTRYVMKDTVEEDMRLQQQWKKRVAALGFEEIPDAIDDDEEAIS